MEWYSVLIICVSYIIGVVIACILDSKQRAKELELKKKKENDLQLSLNCIYDELHKLNEKE